jgi:hypothetical protein
MKRINLMLVFVLGILTTAGAQTITASGVITDKQNNALHYAFIQDKESKKGTYTDSLGNFSLELRGPAAHLTISCTGFTDTVINADGKTPLKISLTTKDGKPIVMASVDNVHNTVRDQMNMDADGYRELASAGSLVPLVHTKEATQGSRLFSGDWLHGYIINDQSLLVQNPAYLLNYDKITGNLLMTTNKTSMISVNKETAKSFTLYDNGTNYTFERDPKIDNNRYALVLSSGPKYKIYKIIRTKFVVASASSNGLTTIGNNYDEYVDEPQYYVVDVAAGQAMKLSLKKKSIKQDFAKEADKVNKFLTENSGGVDEDYLSKLCAYMNQ